MYEPRSARLLSPRQFARRLARHFVIVIAIIGVSLLGGMCGYRYLAGMNWVDAFVNAAMLLGGMGPVGELTSDNAKIFAGLYALYSGLVFIVSAGLLIAPLAHRLFHKFHLDEG